MRVSTPVVRQSLGSVDIEATSRPRRAGVDDNVAIGISKSGVLSSAEIGLRRASAVVDRNDELGGAGDLGGFVVVESDLFMQLMIGMIDNRSLLRHWGSYQSYQ